MNVDIGTLSKRIKIQSTNQDTGVVTPIHECWASVSNISGTEIIKNQGEFAQATTRFLIRYTKKPLTTGTEIVFNNMIYDIVYVNDYNFSHEFIEIITTMRGWCVAN